MLGIEIMKDVKVYKDIKQVSQAVCEKILSLSLSCKEEECAHISLSGGTTPKVIFQMLADNYATKINWSCLHFWWGDERCVDSDSLDSNYGEAKRILFDKVESLPLGNIHPVNTALGPEQACLDYLQVMKKYIKLKNDLPIYDLILLGLGSDGHTAPLFPNDISVDCQKWVAIGTQPETSQSRVSITYKIINNAKEIIFIVTGEAKEEVIKNLFTDKHKSQRYPAHYINPTGGSLIWYMDETASRAVKG